MLLRAVIVMLAMLNLGAAGWWVLQPAPKPVLEGAHAPSLQLLKEAGAHLPAMAGPVAAATVMPAAAAKQGAPAMTAVCLRFGPFADGAARDVAHSALRAAGLKPLTHETAARVARGWKVYLPVQASREAALALAEKLKASGVADLFVMTQGADVNSIALGRFGSEESARRRAAELAGKGVQAQVEPLGGTPAQAWLEVRLPEGMDRTSLASIAPMQPLDCAQLQ